MDERQAQWTADTVQQLVAKGHDAASAQMMAQRMSLGDLQVGVGGNDCLLTSSHVTRRSATL
jgi:hypothetical protein